MPALAVPAPLIISARLMPALRLPDVGTIHLEPVRREDDDEQRVVYRWILEDADGTVLDQREDIRSPSQGDVDLIEAVTALLDFLAAAGDAYRRDMAPRPDAGFSDAAQEWAYLNQDELTLARLELEGDEDN